LHSRPPQKTPRIIPKKAQKIAQNHDSSGGTICRFPGEFAYEPPGRVAIVVWKKIPPRNKSFAAQTPPKSKIQNPKRTPLPLMNKCIRLTNTHSSMTHLPFGNNSFPKNPVFLEKNAIPRSSKSQETQKFSTSTGGNNSLPRENTLKIGPFLNNRRPFRKRRPGRIRRPAGTILPDGPHIPREKRHAVPSRNPKNLEFSYKTFWNNSTEIENTRK
jgi:hypothetical protein